MHLDLPTKGYNIKAQMGCIGNCLTHLVLTLLQSLAVVALITPASITLHQTDASRFLFSRWKSSTNWCPLWLGPASKMASPVPLVRGVQEDISACWPSLQTRFLGLQPNRPWSIVHKRIRSGNSLLPYALRHAASTQSRLRARSSPCQQGDL